MCLCVYPPQLQTAQALTNLRSHFQTWPRHLADPALASASQGSSKENNKSEKQRRQNQSQER